MSRGSSRRSQDSLTHATSISLSNIKVLNLNPRSLYNKKENFKTFLLEREIDVACVSESWERPDEPLDKAIEIENYVVISNPHQRKGVGGRPAIFVNTEKFIVENLTQTVLDIPWGVEAVWCAISPKIVNNNSVIKKIIIGAIYCKPGSRKKTLLLDHITHIYHSLSAKFSDGLSWIICGDTNELKLDSILHLNSKLRQVVTEPTRLNPPAILDPIITDLHSCYQNPKCEYPLEADDDTDVTSDHLMVVMSPISAINNDPKTEKKEIHFRPVTDEGLKAMEQALIDFSWDFIDKIENVDKKVVAFQDNLFEIFSECCPLKSRVISNNSEPYYTEKLRRLKRRKSREFTKHRKSHKYSSLLSLYQTGIEKSKEVFL